MNYCAQCGAERPATAAFCGKCGTPGGAAVASASTAPAPAATQYAGGFVPSRFITTFVLAIFVPIVAIFMAYNGKNEARAAGPTADALNRIAFVVSLVSSIAAVIYFVVFMGVFMVAATTTSGSYYGY